MKRPRRWRISTRAGSPATQSGVAGPTLHSSARFFSRAAARSVFTAFLNEETYSEVCPTEGRTFHNNFERRIECLSDWLHRNAKADDLGGNDPKIVARLLFGMAFGLFHRRVDESQTRSFLDHASLLIEFFFHGVSSKPKTGARKK